MRVFVFANGPFIEGDFTQAHNLSPQFIIGVDGGAAHCHKLGIVPDVILGDLDSIPLEILTEYRTKQVTIKQYPTRKDAADLELALELAVEHGADSIDIFALGGRWDMSLANILMAANTKFQEVDIQLFSGSTKVGILRGTKLHSQRQQRPDFFITAASRQHYKNQYAGLRIPAGKC